MNNQTTLIGHLGKDPKVTQTQNGRAKASFSIATSEYFTSKNGERITQTEWHNVVLWGTLAESAKSVQKGDKVYLSGKLTHRSYKDEAGNQKYLTEVVGKLFYPLLTIKKENHTPPAQTPF